MRVPCPKPSSLPLGRAAGTLVLAAALAQGVHAQAPAASAPAGATAAEVADIQRLIKSGQNTLALQMIDAALAKNPKDPAMRFRRGVTLSMLDRKAEALAVFQKLVEDYPDMPSPYNNMAVIYGSQGDYDKARGALEKAIRTNPAYATAYQNLGDVYAQLASQAYSKALQLDKTDATTPPKLALLRELTTTPPGAATTVAAAAPVAPAAPAPAPAPVSPNKPVQVAAATPAPAPAPAKPAPVPVPVPVPVPAPVHAPAPAPVPAPAPAPVPAARPTPAPASASAPAPAAKTAPAAAPAPSSGVAEVEAAVRAWAAAWSRRDMPAYLGAYTPDFTGSARSHRAWEDDRKARIAPRRRIAVEISDLRVSVNGDKAQAKFRQSYQSDALSTSGGKTLELVRSGGKWLIRQESVGG